MESIESPQGENPVIPTQQINLFSAFAKAQGSFPPIPKDSEVQVKNKEGRFLYSYKYADLTTIIDAVRGPLTANGLSFSQNYVKTDIGVGIATFITHESGEMFMTGFVPCQIQGQDMKQVAGQYTYAKRISLTAALGISADEDVDAGSIEANQGNSTEKTDQKKQAPQHPPENARELTPQEKLMAVVKEAQINYALVPQIIKMVIGEKKKSSELAPIEVQQVIDHIVENYINKGKK